MYVSGERINKNPSSFNNSYSYGWNSHSQNYHYSSNRDFPRRPRRHDAPYYSQTNSASNPNSNIRIADQMYKDTLVEVWRRDIKAYLENRQNDNSLPSVMLNCPPPDYINQSIEELFFNELDFDKSSKGATFVYLKATPLSPPLASGASSFVPPPSFASIIPPPASAAAIAASTAFPSHSLPSPDPPALPIAPPGLTSTPHSATTHTPSTDGESAIDDPCMHGNHQYWNEVQCGQWTRKQIIEVSLSP